MLISKIPYKVDTTTYYEQIRHLDWPVFFDSCYQSDREKSQYARYDIISADPFVKIYSNLNSIKVCEKNQTFHSNDDGLEIVQNYHQQVLKALFRNSIHWGSNWILFLRDG